MTVINKLYHAAFSNVGMTSFVCEYNIIKDKIVIVNHYKKSEYISQEGTEYNNEVLDKVYQEVKQNNILNLY